MNRLLFLVAFALITAPVLTTAARGAEPALAEVNAKRATRGIPPFTEDPDLTAAAVRAADHRAARLLFGHVTGGMGDFQFLAPGVHADAAGCAAYEDRYGWMSCAMWERWNYAGAAWARGSDGKRYMHLFVRNAPPRGDPAAPPAAPPPVAPPVAEPDDTQVNIRPEHRVPNRTGSQCVWNAGETLGRHHGVAALDGLCRTRSGPTDESAFEHTLRSLGVGFASTRRPADWAWFEEYVARRKLGVVVKLGGGPSWHAVVVVHFERGKCVRVIDNMGPNALKVVEWPWDKFAGRYGGWAVAIIPDDPAERSPDGFRYIPLRTVPAR